ncbi:hypothetical protein MTO96_017289 [Rhipicephalus appendiculatus]|uniref:Fanconi anemia group E protein n=1 Tax=Rhipicephalus appendiculatus TaxID=34631 RepID=A0A131YL53_RHIAP
MLQYSMFPLHGRIYADCKRDLVLELLEGLQSKKKNERSEAQRVRVEERCEPLFHFFPRESEPEPFGDVLDVEMSEDEESREEIAPSNGLAIKGPDRDELEVCGAPDDLTDLPEEVQVNISKIKEALHSCDETDIRTADLSFMVSAKPETVAAVCDELETDAIADSKMQLLLRSFSELKSEISLINGVVFVKCALLPKVANLEEGTTARSLIDSITAFAQDMPHVTVEGLLVPLVSAESMGKAQTDVVQTLIKEGIPKDYAAMCLRRMLQESRACIETHVTFVHILILKRGPLESVFTELVNWLASVKDERSTDSKFSKLLMDFVSFYGPQMSPACLDSVVKVVSVNRTLLKKPIQNMLTKLTA